MNDSQQPTLFDADAQDGPVECLGMTFESDGLRREYFLEILREKLKDPEFRQIEGFPIGEDEDILALSDPPYYTACPNPFLEQFIECYGKPYDPETDDYHREPFAADVSEGKNDPIYNAHSYHTKVPHKAIMRYILHYTEPGDIVLDGFAGSGMTGVAAQLCESPGKKLKQELEEERKTGELPQVYWGARKTILNDLSPAATFISANYNLPFNVASFHMMAQKILDELSEEIGWMYQKLDSEGNPQGEIDYTVWSDVFGCPQCSSEITFLEEALDPDTDKIKSSFPCPNCGVDLTKKSLDRIYETYFDHYIGKTAKRVKRKPVFIYYSVGKNRYSDKPSNQDLKNIQKISEIPFPETVPLQEIPFMHMTHQRARMDNFGVNHIHHFFTHRSAIALGILWKKVNQIQDLRQRNMLTFFAEQAIWTLSLMNRYRPTGYSQVNQYMTGVYYIASQVSECSPWYVLRGKMKRLVKALQDFSINRTPCVNATVTTADLSIPNNSIDYIFTDPPFGENIYYADLNFLVESWHNVKTNSEPEAIIDKAKHKDLLHYQRLMQKCFERYFQALKPGRWMTVVFHNSRNSVWNAIQEAMTASGFVIADVRTLDKQQGSYRQVTSTAVKQDLIISSYKPGIDLERKFEIQTGSDAGVWTFIQEHLDQLPPFVSNKGKAEVIAERQGNMLFDRMVAFHVQRGVTVPLSASEFYAGLDQRFPQRDGMYFLPEQVAEYDRKRMTVKEVLQLELFVNDESTAVQWLRQQLTKKPQTFQELHPQFLKAIGGWAKHEKTLELSDLLEQNYLRYDGGNIPKQIVSWLAKSSVQRAAIAKALGHESSAARSQESEGSDEQQRNLLGRVPDTGLETRDASLIAAAKDRWYIPDPNKAGDLEKLRDKSLLREFEEYRDAKKKLKVFRTEAVRAGFKHFYQQRDYKTIIQVARKIPEAILQEDPKLLMFYDNAVTRAGEE